MGKTGSLANRSEVDNLGAVVESRSAGKQYMQKTCLSDFCSQTAGAQREVSAFINMLQNR
jgi:hypothetical protein